MAKKANLANALDDVTPAPRVSVTTTGREANTAPIAARAGMALVGAHLPAKYQKAMKLLSAETDKSQRELLAEALDMLFVAKGVKLNS